MDMKTLIKAIVTEIVDDGDSVQVGIIKSQVSEIIELTVAKEDVGKVIGRSGRTADAIRTILLCIGAKNRIRYVLQIIDG